jgi:hypothetical protein
MLALVGKASPHPLTGEIEYFLRDFEDQLANTGRFAYAWTFNPDENAIRELSTAIASKEPVFLYLPATSGMSPLRMRVADFRHDPRPAGSECPPEWRKHCIEELVERRSFGPGPHERIHLWLLIDSVEQLSPEVNLRTEFRPALRSKYAKWGQRYFAFLRPASITWVENPMLDFKDVGHGLLFFSEAPGSADSLVAVLRGFDWLHGRPSEIFVETSPAGAAYGEEYLQAARNDIEKLIRDPDSLPGVRNWLSPRLYVHGNV